MGCDDYPKNILDGRFKLGEPVAELWNETLLKRFPHTSHTTCFQQMHAPEGHDYPIPYFPARCQDWHCPDCGAPVTMYGKHQNPCTAKETE